MNNRLKNIAQDILTNISHEDLEEILKTFVSIEDDGMSVDEYIELYGQTSNVEYKEISAMSTVGKKEAFVWSNYIESRNDKIVSPVSVESVYSKDDNTVFAIAA